MRTPCIADSVRSPERSALEQSHRREHFAFYEFWGAAEICLELIASNSPARIVSRNLLLHGRLGHKLVSLVDPLCVSRNLAQGRRVETGVDFVVTEV